MGISVVFHGMPPRDDLTYQLGVLAHAAADAEKTGARAMTVEQVQHLGRHHGIGAVIEGERHLAAPACIGWQACQRMAKPAVARQKHQHGEQQMIQSQQAQPVRPVPRPPHQRQQAGQMPRDADPDQRNRAPNPAFRFAQFNRPVSDGNTRLDRGMRRQIPFDGRNALHPAAILH